MTKRITSLALALLMLFSVFSAMTVNAEDVKILNTLSIKVGETKPLNFTDPNGNKVSVLWESSNPDIATVDDKGNVKGKKVGTCVISTWWNSKLYGVKINVKAAPKKVSISKKKLTLKVGKKTTLKLKNANASKVKWSSSNKKVATVSKGVIKAKKVGKATITATYKKKKYKCTVTVKKSGMTKQQAFNKVKNYLIKNGYKDDTGVNVFYTYSWVGDDNITYEITYNSGEKMIILQALCDYMTNYTCFDAKNTGYSTYDAYGKTAADEWGAFVEFKKNELVLKNGLDYKYEYGKKTSADNVKSQANSYLQWTLPEFNKKLKKITGVNLKQLGFTKWNNK